MAAPAAAIINASDQAIVQKWEGRVSADGNALYVILNQLAATSFQQNVNRMSPDAVYQLPRLNWDWQSNWIGTARIIKSFSVNVFENAPLLRLMDKDVLVGIACNIPSLNKVVVFSWDNFFQCGHFTCECSLYPLHVKNFIDCEEAHAMHKLLKDWRAKNAHPVIRKL